MKRRKTTKIHGRSGFSIIDDIIFVDILLKLSMKSIVNCKSVCKRWHSLISGPQFTAKFHSRQSKTCRLLIRDIRDKSFSRALYLLNPEEHVDDRKSINLKSKLKAPIRDPQAMLSHMEVDDTVIFGRSMDRSGKKNLIRIDHQYHVYKIARSCNGLLCLADRDGVNPPLVSNPVTGEFFHLPNSSNDMPNSVCLQVGFGFGSKSNKYKVIRTFIRWIKDPNWRRSDQTAEIHTLGTDCWRNIDVSKIKQEFAASVASPTYADGAIHWLFNDIIGDSGCSLVSFDVDEEIFRFHSIPSPPSSQSRGNRRLTMGVIGGRLCVYNDIARDRIDIWAMKPELDVFEYSWTKLFSVDVSSYDEAGGRGGSHRYQPICCLENGDLVLFDVYHNKLLYFDKLGGLRVKHLILGRLKSSLFGAIAHTPSFISLKDIVAMAGNNAAEVHNVNLRCGKIKLIEENYRLRLKSE